MERLLEQHQTLLGTDHQEEGAECQTGKETGIPTRFLKAK